MRGFCAAIAALTVAGCIQEEVPEPRVCTVAGTTVNIGSTTGGVFATDLGQNHILRLDNTNLNLFVPATGGNALIEVGSPECLEDITFTGGTTYQVAFQPGQAYAAKFGDNTQARFFALAYRDGVGTIRYQYPF